MITKAINTVNWGSLFSTEEFLLRKPIYLGRWQLSTFPQRLLLPLLVVKYIVYRNEIVEDCLFSCIYILSWNPYLIQDTDRLVFMQNYLHKWLDFVPPRYILWKLLLNHEGIVKWSAPISLTLVSVRSATVFVHVCRQKVVVPYCLLAAQKDANASACKVGARVGDY